MVSASVLCPLFHCQIHQGAAVSPTESMHNGVICLPHPDYVLESLLKLINCSHSEALLLVTFSEEPPVKLPVSTYIFSLPSCLLFEDSCSPAFSSRVLQFPSGFFCLLLQSQQCFCSSAQAFLSFILLHLILTLPSIPSMSIHMHDSLLTYRSSAPFQGSFPTLLLLASLPTAQSGFL